MNFNHYLYKKEYAKSSITYHEQTIKRFKNWCRSTKYNIEKITYKELLKYQEYLLSKSTKKATISNYLNSIKKYYDFLTATKQIKTNPAKDIYIRNKQSNLLQDILTHEELENIYDTYSNLTPSIHTSHGALRHNRNTAIVGLMIYQGLHIGEIRRLEKHHVKLKEGKIYIPSTKRSNSRILKLEAKQVFPLMAYMNQTRQELLSIQKRKTDKLFFGKNQLHYISSTLKKQLKGMFPHIRNLDQIRASVFINWLEHHNIRQVQYMAGHKYISSTERYKKEDLKGLQQQLELFHPLN